MLSNYNILFVVLYLSFGKKTKVKQENRDIQLQQLNNPWYTKYRYTLTDGSANFYSFGYNWFHYRPVTQNESSSGLYDGGKEINVKDKVGFNDYCRLIDVIERSYQVKSDHAAFRNMGDLHIVVANENNAFIADYVLKRNTASFSNVEVQLNNIKNKL